MRDLVEQAITKFLRHFVREPYRHRVEHSLHSDLIARLRAIAKIRHGVVHLTENHRCRLIHKEWPGTCHDGCHNRANVDIAVLKENDVNHPYPIEDFRKGRLPACAGIEMGLDFGEKHFDRDIAKQENNFNEKCFDVCYVIHLSRVANASQARVRENIGLRVADGNCGGVVIGGAILSANNQFELLLPGHNHWQPAEL